MTELLCDRCRIGDSYRIGGQVEVISTLNGTAADSQSLTLWKVEEAEFKVAEHFFFLFKAVHILQGELFLLLIWRKELMLTSFELSYLTLNLPKHSIDMSTLN